MAAKPDQVRTLTTLAVDLMEGLLGDCVPWVVQRSVELESDAELIAERMMRTSKLLIGLAELLTEAVPIERERIARQPYSSDYGTQLKFSVSNYQPGNWARYVIPVEPRKSVIDELAARENARPKPWLHSARGAMLSYVAEFWDECVPRVSQYLGKGARKSAGYLERALDLPRGQKLLFPSDYFRDVHHWRSWARIANNFPKLVNGLAVKEWIKREGAARVVKDNDRTVKDARHSPDFRSVNWFGKEYTFTATQAACTKVFWEAWENGTPDVGEPTVLEAADSSQQRLAKVFDSGKHPAWNTMICQGDTKGTFRLTEPKQPERKKKVRTEKRSGTRSGTRQADR